jgi:hypothetical protein
VCSGVFKGLSPTEDIPPMLVGVEVLPAVVAEFGGGDDPVSLGFIGINLAPMVVPSVIVGIDFPVLSDSKYDSS